MGSTWIDSRPTGQVHLLSLYNAVACFRCSGTDRLCGVRPLRHRNAHDAPARLPGGRGAFASRECRLRRRAARCGVAGGFDVCRLITVVIDAVLTPRAWGL